MTTVPPRAPGGSAARIVTALPRAVREVEDCRIPMPDGCRLAARLWLPADAERAPVPAVLEYIPYRKRDFTRARDEPMHRWFAGHGYAAVRVDVRGTGESDGLLADEYSEQELDDGLEVIRWLAAQPWCTGAVGMIGKSWGGFNALQLAARRPAALRAIVTVCASDDRYADDAHYMGGCLLNENLTWGAVLLTMSVLPPDPALAGPGWRVAWQARIDGAVLHPETWLRHPDRDAYWKRGSVGDAAGTITCAVYAVGGWADAYTDAVPRLVAGLPGVRRGLVGPWSHQYPHEGVPGPAIGFLQEALRWWDQWLAGRDTGVLDEPAYRVWMQESAPPGSEDGARPGRWVAEAAWPSPRIAPRRYALAPGCLVEGPAPEERLDACSAQTVGLAAGDWCSFGVPGDGPGDQREDDAGSLAFDSAPLAARLEILGAPVVHLELAVDRPAAFLAIRLNEVLPDGASARVTYGVLNLAHRAGRTAPVPLEPGRRYRVTVELRNVAHAFAPGSRVRLAVSTTYWPIVWPSPEPVTVSVFTGTSAVELPVRPSQPEDALLRPFPPPESAPPAPYTAERPGRSERTVERDAATGEVVYTVLAEGGGFGTPGPGRFDAIDLALAHTILRRYRIHPDDPGSARAEVIQTVSLRRGPWAVRVESYAALRATAEGFALEAHVEAFEGDARVAERRWTRTVPRDKASEPRTR